MEISRPNSKPFLVSSWYRPPNSKIEMFHYFEEFLKLADIENKQLIITKDLNCNLLEASGSVIIGEYSPRLRLGEYSPIITSRSANNC